MSKVEAFESENFGISVWRRYTLTIEEVAMYYHLVEAKPSRGIFHYEWGQNAGRT